MGVAARSSSTADWIDQIRSLLSDESVGYVEVHAQVLELLARAFVGSRQGVTFDTVVQASCAFRYALGLALQRDHGFVCGLRPTEPLPSHVADCSVPGHTALPPDSVHTAAWRAFEEGETTLARRLLCWGRRWYPEHVGIAEAREQLAEPRVAVAAPSACRPDPSLNQAWIDENRGRYRNQWVVLHGRRLLAASPQPRDLDATKPWPRHTAVLFVE